MDFLLFCLIQITTGAIWQHFGKFGDVIRVDIQEGEGHRLAIVSFGQAIHDVLPRTHFIANKRINLTVPVAVQDHTKLLDLNYDCLEKILFLLEFKDLCSVAGACNRLQELARDIYVSKWKTSACKLSTVQEVEDYLRHFGSVGGCLEIHNVKLTDARSLNIPVRMLTLHSCAVSIGWLVQCRELVELELIDAHITYRGLRNQKCPNLKRLKIRGSKSWAVKGLKIFLEQNKQLKSLQVIPMRHEDYSSVFDPIQDFLPESIESLAIVPSPITQLKRFHALKQLQISCAESNYDMSVVNRLGSDATLTHLDIYGGMNWMLPRITRESANAISQLTKVKTLKLRKLFMNNMDLVRMVEQLKELTHLHLDAWRCIASQHDLLDVIREGCNLQQILLLISYEADLELNAETYRKMLEQRTSKERLHIIIISRNENLNCKMDLNFSMQPSLKITFYTYKNVHTIVRAHGKCNKSCDYYFQISEKELKILRDHDGLDIELDTF